MQYGILDWILEQKKKDILWKHLRNLGKVWSLVNSIVLKLVS